MHRAHFLSLIAAAPAVAAAASLPPAAIALGDERFLADEWRAFRGKRIGIITNQTGVTSRMVNIVDAAIAHGGIDLRAIYAPEHGLRGDRYAGAYVDSYRDERTGLPVYSLYGPQRHPTAAMLDGVDVLLFDIQDVGSRAYTYISTMAYAMESAAKYGKEIVILDRPNPIGGTMVEGPVLDPRFRSFIGLYPIAMRHGMTVGELARLFNDRFGIGAALHVVPMAGWTREMLWPQTGLQWVQTSPNVPEWSTAVVLVCSGLVGNAGLDNGVGTTRPFKYVGQMGMDAYRFADALNAQAIPGIYCAPSYWSPLFGAMRGREYAGVALDVFDAHRFPAVRTAVELLVQARRVDPSVIRINESGLAFDWGTDTLARALRAGRSTSEIVAAWQPRLTAFLNERAQYLIYR